MYEMGENISCSAFFLDFFILFFNGTEEHNLEFLTEFMLIICLFLVCSLTILFKLFYWGYMENNHVHFVRLYHQDLYGCNRVYLANECM